MRFSLPHAQFLAQAGFTLDNWQALEIAIRELNRSAEAFPDRTNEYGTFYIRHLQNTNSVM